MEPGGKGREREKGRRGEERYFSWAVWGGRASQKAREVSFTQGSGEAD
jgi:hypothetical protein